jgi:eukaryotic-like serine/threonine-protein kinase
MAEVFRAVAQGVEGFQRVFVIKRILQDKSSSREFIDMFISEARVSALLNHPNIVQIYDFGQVGGSYFLSMEYLRGKDLINVMRKLRTSGAQLDPSIAAYIAQQVAQALHYAHSMSGQGGQSLGIVHRDVSPSNIMLLRAGGVKLLDFGIARAELGDKPAELAEGSSTIIKGKLSYLSPEQVRAESIDSRSDIFSLGVCLWEMLTGRRLFFDETDRQTMRNVLDRPIIPPSMKRFDAPTALDYIVLRALERDPERRYNTAKEMADELDTYLTELNFSPSQVPRMLDALFGEDAGQFEAQLPDASQSGMWSVAASEGSLAASLSSASVQPISFDVGGALPSSQVPHRSGLSRGAILAMAGSGVAFAAAIGLFLASGRTGSPIVAPVQAVAPAPEPEPVPLPQPPVKPVAAKPVPVLSGKINVRFQTVPRAAAVYGPDGTLLGRTPLSFELNRSADPVEIVVRKERCVESRHRIVPDRDMSALLTLRLDNKKKRGKGPAEPEPVDQLEISPLLLDTPAVADPTAASVAPTEPAPVLPDVEPAPVAPAPVVPEAAKVDPYATEPAATAPTTP